MAYNNVPVNGWPQIKDLEKLDALAKQIENMPTYTSVDRAFLDEWEANLPALAQDVSDLETEKVNQVQIATVEESTTASKAYSAGEYLVLGGVLYKATDDIAQDGTIVTEGAEKNADLATVGGELSGLNSKLTKYNLAKTLYNDIEIYIFGAVTYNTNYADFPLPFNARPTSITVDTCTVLNVEDQTGTATIYDSGIIEFTFASQLSTDYRYAPARLKCTLHYQ